MARLFVLPIVHERAKNNREYHYNNLYFTSNYDTWCNRQFETRTRPICLGGIAHFDGDECLQPIHCGMHEGISVEISNKKYSTNPYYKDVKIDKPILEFNLPKGVHYMKVNYNFDLNPEKNSKSYANSLEYNVYLKDGDNYLLILFDFEIVAVKSPAKYDQTITGYAFNKASINSGVVSRDTFLSYLYSGGHRFSISGINL